MGLSMMLVTSTRSPPSCTAKLPQKFSAATTSTPSLLMEPPDADEHAPRLAETTSPMAITATRRVRIIDALSAPAPAYHNESRSQ